MEYNMYDNLYAGILKVTPHFNCGDHKEDIQYHFDSELQTLVDRYHLETIAGKGSDSEKIIRMVEWLSKHCFHNGHSVINGRLCAENLLEYSFDRGEKHGINCRCLSITLTECLLALGIRARTMYMMPMSPYDTDNHVVCEAFAADLGKWIMVDPTYGGYLLDQNNTILNLMELRSMLANQEPIHLSENFNYNGQKVNLEEKTIYYAKDLFFLHCCKIQGYCSNADDNHTLNPSLTFAPVGFDAALFFLTRYEMAKTHSLNSKQTEYIQNKINSIHIVYQDPKILY